MIEQLEQQNFQQPALPALLALAVPRDRLRAAVLLAARPRHAVGADVAALAVGVDGAAKDSASKSCIRIASEGS